MNTPTESNRCLSSTEDHEFENWLVNTGNKVIHAKRMPGRFRTLKNITAGLWSVFFLTPYLRWNDRQAILFDIPNGQFHFFNATILPHDIWMLAFVLLLLAVTLFAATTLASRMFCGYFCFQTVWTDWFTWVEQKIEGSAAQRHKLDRAPWTMKKVGLKTAKHTIWLLIATVTGISFSIWFTDAYDYWLNLLQLQLSTVAWVTLGMFVLGTYTLAGYMREQVCLWMCPYSRIQGVFSNEHTVLPAYDSTRGEPRQKIRKLASDANRNTGDCIDCFQCVQVCPTGIDIRNGHQLGCITCGLCIDACDTVMDKIGRPHGLIRYASMNEMAGKPVCKPYQQPAIIGYALFCLISIASIVYGFVSMETLTLSVEHERQPLFVQLSDGSIQNQYLLKITNKTQQDLFVRIRNQTNDPHFILVGAESPILARHGHTTPLILFIKSDVGTLHHDVSNLTLRAEDDSHPASYASYTTQFFSPPTK